MKKILPVILFPCPETGHFFKTEKLAAENAAKIRAAKSEAEKQQKESARLAAERKNLFEFQTNFVRLNAESVSEIPKLLVEKAKEFFGTIVKIKSFVTFGVLDICISHNAPLGEKTVWPDYRKPLVTRKGINGKITGRILEMKDSHKNAAYHFSLHNLFAGNQACANQHFVGFHTGGGCAGSKTYDFDMQFCLFLQDFPLLAAKYKNLETEQNKKNLWNEKLSAEFLRVAELQKNNLQTKTLEREIVRLTQVLTDWRNSLFKQNFSEPEKTFDEKILDNLRKSFTS